MIFSQFLSDRPSINSMILLLFAALWAATTIVFLNVAELDELLIGQKP
jgi:hypothetical protein